MQRFVTHRLAVMGAVLLLMVSLVAIFAPWVATHDPLDQDLGSRLLPPSKEHFFGTDTLGRDLFSRVVYGARVSLIVGPIAAAISLTLGLIVGCTSGYFGGRVDLVLQRVVDVVMCIPSFFLILAIVAMFGSSMVMTMVVIGLVHWTSPARLIRGEFLRVRQLEFAEAARALGVSDMKIMWRHLLPNIIAPVIVQTTLFVAAAILIEAGLSYLGLGTQPPQPSWGNILTLGGRVLHRAWWVATFPGAMIFLTIMALNLLGDGLRDALDPRQHTSG